MAQWSLEDALKECLADDGKIDKYEARVIREFIMADGIVSEDEKRFLEKLWKTITSMIRPWSYSAAFS